MPEDAVRSDQPVREVVAVVAPGAGSTPDFLASALGDALSRRGMHLVTTSGRSGRVDSIAEEIDALVTTAVARDATVGLVGGVSVGAHAAAFWASQDASPGELTEQRGSVPQARELVLWLPAWTGSQAAVDGAEPSALGQGLAMTRWAAERVRERGPEAVLDELERDPALRDDWVTAELRRAWPTFGPGELERVLTQASDSDAPDETQLSRIQLPTSIIGMVADPFHPLEVAMQWARTIPNARLMLVDRAGGEKGARRFGDALGRLLDKSWRPAISGSTRG